jgi:hypothetical protein
MIKHFCDRCGKEIPKNDERTYVTARNQLADICAGMKPEYELCLDCKHKLEKFLEGSK